MEATGGGGAQKLPLAGPMGVGGQRIFIAPPPRPRPPPPPAEVQHLYSSAHLGLGASTARPGSALHRMFNAPLPLPLIPTQSDTSKAPAWVSELLPPALAVYSQQLGALALRSAFGCYGLSLQQCSVRGNRAAVSPHFSSHYLGAAIAASMPCRCQASCHPCPARCWRLLEAFKFLPLTPHPLPPHLLHLSHPLPSPSPLLQTSGGGIFSASAGGVHLYNIGCSDLSYVLPSASSVLPSVSPPSEAASLLPATRNLTQLAGSGCPALGNEQGSGFGADVATLPVSIQLLVRDHRGQALRGE